jgi:hypothetical protein
VAGFGRESLQQAQWWLLVYRRGMALVSGFIVSRNSRSILLNKLKNSCSDLHWPTKLFCKWIFRDCWYFFNCNWRNNQFAFVN